MVAKSARYESGVPVDVGAEPPRPRRPLFTVLAAIREQPRSALARRAKRAIDIVGSALGLATFAPVLAATAVAVKLTSPGPVLFVQDRVGLGGRRFRFYKFRTMVDDAESLKAELAHLNEMRGPVFKIERDPRMTPLGAILRKLSIDELPQFWNVLKGEMSLVGPRPPTPDEVEQYDDHHAQRLSVMPGMTGLWQVSGRSEINDFETWLALDLAYAHRWSLLLDLEILLKTPIVVLLTRGAQ